MAPPGQVYKIKHSSGRVLGPLDLERVKRLIIKNQILGTEIAREYPLGDWQDINLISEIAALLVAKASGSLEEERKEMATVDISLPGTTLPGTAAENNLPDKIPSSAPTTLLPEATRAVLISSNTVESAIDMSGFTGRANSDDEGTVVAEAYNADSDEGDKTVVGGATAVVAVGLEREVEEATSVYDPDGEGFGKRRISEERTVVFLDRPINPIKALGRKKVGSRPMLQWLVIAVAGVFILSDMLYPEKSNDSARASAAFRPTLPAYTDNKVDPALSAKAYAEAMPFYLSDTVIGYKRASEKLLLAASLDINNVRALAILASCYLNLIDSSNKDENYFSVILKLIDMSRAKAMDLPETIIADVEYYITVNRAEAAQNRIVEYTKLSQNFDLMMFYYLAYAFYQRGDHRNAATFISRMPPEKIFTARVYYLRGLIAEKLGDESSAINEYRKALTLNKDHSRSRLRIAEIAYSGGRIKTISTDLDLLVGKPSLLNPKDLGRAYFLHAQLLRESEKWDLALADIERSVRLDKDNSDYLLELFTLRAKSGESPNAVRRDARMYYFLSEGQRQVKLGDYQEALTAFLQARQTNIESHLPLVKIGDMFFYLNDIANSKMNYELAAQRAPKSVDVWSKYINVLILSYDWEEAQKAMERFRMLPVSQSAIDKAAGDMYAKQGKHREAQTYYKKAMAREVIDAEVYIAYAKSLIATKNFKEAPSFFSLALRYDPLNIDALIGTAKCIAAAESIDRAINMLRDELQKGGISRAELIAAIAEFQIQKGEWKLAQQFVDEAIEANPDYAHPWKLQAQIFLNREGQDKAALDKALSAYKSFSDRNASDPSGYLERYRVFIKKAEFERASEELEKIYTIYPKYPNLHYYKGALYVIMGNHKAAVEEFTRELKNNPNNVNTMLALGKALIEVGSVQEALNHFTKAMQLAPRWPEAKSMAAYANYLLKNFQSAVALYRAALSLDPANPTIYKRLGLAYWDMGDPVGARAAFRKYLEMEPDAADKAEFERFL